MQAGQLAAAMGLPEVATFERFFIHVKAVLIGLKREVLGLVFSEPLPA